MSDFGVADYLVEFSKVHRSQIIYTEFCIYRGLFPWSIVMKEDKTPGGEPLLDPPGAELLAWF